MNTVEVLRETRSPPRASTRDKDIMNMIIDYYNPVRNGYVVIGLWMGKLRVYYIQVDGDIAVVSDVGSDSIASILGSRGWVHTEMTLRVFLEANKVRTVVKGYKVDGVDGN